jgi:hypothetical protein
MALPSTTTLPQAGRGFDRLSALNSAFDGFRESASLRYEALYVLERRTVFDRLRGGPSSGAAAGRPR